MIKSTELRTAVDSLQASIDDVLEAIRNREQRSDVRREDSSVIRQRIEALLKFETDKEKARRRRNKIAGWAGGAATFVTAVALGVWQGVEQSRPPKPSIENVQATVEERTTALETEVRSNVERLTTMEDTLGEVRDLLQGLTKKIDAANVPAPEPDPQPARRNGPRRGR